MRAASLRVATCATLLRAGTALATPTAQQNCDYARIKAWKVYTSCVDRVVAKGAKGVIFDDVAAFAKCRHTYFKKWTGLQAAKYTGSTCIGSRLTDNGTTVTDNLTGLVWEKKDNLDATTNYGDERDADNLYTWSTGSNKEDGTAFTSFLGLMNTLAGFAGSNGWRLPTFAELQTNLKDFTCTGAGGGPTCTCGAPPCIDATFGPTQSDSYWSATGYVPIPGGVWFVGFGGGGVGPVNETSDDYVRAVRGGL